jgi:hypothetical protein
MSFAAPWFLIAILAAGIPLLIHLIHRRTAREVLFPTLRFLKLSVERTRRRRTIEELGLLLLRMGALVLIALGLARPAITGWNRIWNRGPSTAALIVLDNSGSMAAMETGSSRFDRAKAAALAVLDQMKDGDLVALDLPCGPAGPERGRFHTQHETIRQAISQARFWAERADLAAAVKSGRERLEKEAAANREIFIISDQQANSWEGMATQDEGRRPGTPRPIAVILLPIAGAAEPNVALGRLRVEAPAPVPGVPVQASVEVANLTDVPQQKHVEFLIDGRREALSPDLMLAPGARVTQVFRFTHENAGVHRGEIRLVEPDGNPLDNQVSFVQVTDQEIRVAVVKVGAAAAPGDDAAYYLERALDSGETGGAVETTVIPADQMAGVTWSDFRLIFLVDVPAVPDDVIGRLGEHVQSGGHVVWICGPRVRPEEYRRMAAAGPAGLLPAIPGPSRQPVEGGKDAWKLSGLDGQYPAFAPLVDPPSLYQSVLITQARDLEFEPAAGGSVLAARDDGKALWVMRSVGAGSAHMIGTAWHTDWSNWPLRPIFLPMVLRLTYQLAGARAQGGELTVGSPMLVPVDAKAGGSVNLEVARPTGELIRLRDQKSADGFVRYDDTHEPGVYLARALDQPGGRTVGFGVNPDPLESDPEVLSMNELATKLAPAAVAACEKVDDLPRLLRDLREGQSLRDWFLAGVLLALLVEAAVANRKRPVAEPAGGSVSVESERAAGPLERDRGEALDMGEVVAEVAAQAERVAEDAG